MICVVWILQIYKIGIMLLLLSESCKAFYASNAVITKPTFDDGMYRPSEYDSGGAQYKFGYKVNEVKTGDIKHHTESRKENEVKGEYSVVEPNGVIRLVQYIANSKGFNAIVRHQYGTKYATNLNTTLGNTNIRLQQEFHSETSTENNSEQSTERQYVLPKQLIVSPENAGVVSNIPDSVSLRPNTISNRFLPEQRSKQSGTVRQSFPKSITNKSIRENSSEKPVFSSTQVPFKTTIGRRRQYEVIDPEVDIDIRRSISKPFLTITKLKPTQSNNNI